MIYHFNAISPYIPKSIEQVLSDVCSANGKTVSEVIGRGYKSKTENTNVKYYVCWLCYYANLGTLKEIANYVFINHSGVIRGRDLTTQYMKDKDPAIMNIHNNTVKYYDTLRANQRITAG